MIVGIIYVAWIQHAQLPSATGATQATSQRLQKDVRLAKKITVSTDSIYLGELLEQLQEATGTSIRSDEGKGAISGRLLSAVIQDKSAATIMEGIQKLYDAPPDRYYWRADRQNNTTSYVLAHTLSPEQNTQLREEFTRGFLLDQHRRVSSFYNLDAEQRVQAAAADPDLRFAGNPKTEAQFSFVRNLSPIQLQSILDGSVLSLRYDQLSDTQRKLISSNFAAEVSRGRSLPSPGPDTSIDILRTDSGSMPLISVKLGKYGVIPILGGMPALAAQRDWGLSRWGSTKSESKVPNVLLEMDDRNPKGQLGRKLGGSPALNALAIAELSRTDVLYDRFFRFNEQIPFPKLPIELPTALSQLKESFIWKHSDPFLYLRRPDWPTMDCGALAPWPVIRELRQTTEQNDGYLTREQWLDLATLSREQLATLSGEFPDCRTISSFQVLLGLFGAMDKKEQQLVTQPQGAGWNDLSNRTRSKLLVLFSPTDARRMRIHLDWSKEGERRVFQPFLGPGPVRQREIPLRKREDPDRKSATGVAPSR